MTTSLSKTQNKTQSKTSNREIMQTLFMCCDIDSDPCNMDKEKRLNDQMTNLLNRIDINKDRFGGRTFLVEAVFTDNPERVKLAFAMGADPDIRDAYGCTALHYVVKNSMYAVNAREITQIFIDNHANLNATDRDGETPLFWGTRLENEDICNILLLNGASPFSPVPNFSYNALSICKNKIMALRLERLYKTIQRDRIELAKPQAVGANCSEFEW